MSEPEDAPDLGGRTWSQRLRALHPKHFFLDTWRELDAEAAALRRARAEAGKGYDFQPLGALVLGAVCLTLMEYFGHDRDYYWAMDQFDPPMRIGRDGFWASLRDSEWQELGQHAWWAIWRVGGYLVVPALYIKLVLRERIRDHGLSLVGLRQHAWIYVLSYLVVLVCVFAVSFDPHFQTYYPFYPEHPAAPRAWLDFLGWELMYAAQFFSLEFFFRGFWLHAMRRSLGSQAIFAMVVPYCMIHFGKPFLETLAAIIAGIVLGTLAMKTRSIWSGFLVHVSVALSMDIAALLQTDRMPTRLLPW